LTHDGLERSYYLHLPPTYETNTVLPVVLVLHSAGGGDGLVPAKDLGFTALADGNDFIMVYPNGIDGVWRAGAASRLRGRSDDTVDDVGFISELVDHLIREQKADPDRVYVTGQSNGGMMTLRVGCEMASKLRAIAPFVASFPKDVCDTCRPDAQLSVLLMNGTADRLVPWNGIQGQRFGRETSGIVSTAETVEFWVEYNQCDLAENEIALPDTDTTDGSTVTLTRYANETTDVEVLLYTVEGGGHSLPGSATNGSLIRGNKNNDIDGAAAIWDFFKQHSR
jgi:polyhydroxybutyrate depolymerase